MIFFTKAGLALIAAGITWAIANAVGGFPRPLDFYIFYAVEYAGVTVIFMKKGWE